MSPFKRFLVDKILKVSGLVSDVMLPQIQLLNAHMINLGEYERLYSIGRMVGEQMARDIGKRMAGDYNFTLKEYAEFVPFTIKHITGGKSEGWVIKVDDESGILVFGVRGSPYCRLPNGSLIKSGRPVCALFAGICAGGLSVILKRPYRVREVKCEAMGDDHCEFVAEPA